MDSLIAAAARALSVGDPLAALDRVALRGDPPALALRGIAMAQLGEYDRARRLLRRAARGFGPTERLPRARCAAAEAEVALAARDLRAPPEALDAVARILAALGDHDNARHARLVAARRMVLLGQLDEADRALDEAVVDETATPDEAASGSAGRVALLLRRRHEREAPRHRKARVIVRG